MDGDRPSSGEVPAQPAPARRHAAKLPAWVDAVPVELDINDHLEVVANLSFRSLATALARVHADPFMKVGQRVQLIAQINAQLVGVMSKRRLWLAEQVIKGNDRVIAELKRSAALEVRDHAAGTNSDQQASRPSTRRGRPRKR